MLESLLNKIAGLSPATVTKRNSWADSFPVSFANFLRIPIFGGHLQWVASVSNEIKNNFAKNCNAYEADQNSAQVFCLIIFVLLVVPGIKK